jgi:hypothetical protein
MRSSRLRSSRCQRCGFASLHQPRIVPGDIGVSRYRLNMARISSVNFATRHSIEIHSPLNIGQLEWLFLFG